MAGFFGFGAFSSPVGQLVERATDNAASAGNLALHLQICDEINETDHGSKDAVTAIRKRLTSNIKNFHIINLTLTVLETCVKNCGMRFHVKIAQRDFLGDLMKVIHPKNNPPTIVKERILGLIQYWADAFKGKPQLVAVIELYDQLRSDGTEFPPIDLDAMAPVETPERISYAQQQPPGHQPPYPQQQQPGQQLQLAQPGAVPPQGAPASSGRRRPRGPIGPLKPEQIAKLLSELDVVRRNMDVMNEIMTENEPGKEGADDMELLEEVNRVLHAMQTRVADLIDRVQDEIILESTLQINDELNSVFVRYERYCRNREAATSDVQQPQEETHTQVVEGVATTSLTEPSQPIEGAPTISYPSLGEQPPTYEDTAAVGQLIDLGTEIAQPQQPTSGGDIIAQLAELGITSTASGSQQPASQQPASQQPTTDEFDIFAQSRTAYSTQGGSTYDDNLIQQDVSLTQKVHGRTPTPQEQQQPEHPYANLTEWLAQTDLTTPSGGTATEVPPTEESATSAEFDQFLAQRASKGDSLPARSRPKMQKAEDQSDELFAL